VLSSETGIPSAIGLQCLGCLAAWRAGANFIGITSGVYFGVQDFGNSFFTFFTPLKNL